MEFTQWWNNSKEVLLGKLNQEIAYRAWEAAIDSRADENGTEAVEFQRRRAEVYKGEVERLGSRCHKLLIGIDKAILLLRETEIEILERLSKLRPDISVLAETRGIRDTVSLLESLEKEK